MRLLVANDQGRLSQDKRLADLSVIEIPLLATDVNAFVQTFKEQDCRCVLFWHQDPIAALKLLNELIDNEVWPRSLAGVVLFRAAHYAGLSSRSEAEAAIESFHVPRSKIHVLSDIVQSHPDLELIDRIRRFAEAIQHEQVTVLPFRLLEPEDHDGAIFTLMLIDVLANEGWNCASEILGDIDWTQAAVKCASFGIDFPSKVSLKALREVARQLRPHIHNYLDILCRPCGVRSFWSHTKLPQIRYENEPERTQQLLDACTAIQRLLSSSSDLRSNTIKNNLQRVAKACRDQAASPLGDLITRKLQQECGLVKNEDQIVVALSATKNGIAFRHDTGELTCILADALACPSLGNISLDHDFTADFNN
jgi:hypothetical protein